jgi:DNA adenine methylase
LPFDRLIASYDRPDTLFYLDPPYWGNETDYGEGVFSRADFEVLAGRLAALKGRFILSLNDTPGVRETFSAFEVETVSTVYSVNGRHPRAVQEVIITSRPR